MNNQKPKITIPETFMGVPIKGAMERVLSKAKNQTQIPVQSPSTALDRKGMIYVSSANLYFAKPRTYLDKNWKDTHKLLAQEKLRMPTIEEFRKTLNYLKNSQEQEYQELYNEITEVRGPWRAGWLDAYFEKRKDGLYLLTGNKTKAEKLENCLMEDKIPGISLENWLEGKNITSQGLPSSNIDDGKLYYWCPVNNEVARFATVSDWAALDCYGYPSGRSSYLGVFAVADIGKNAR